MATSTEMKKLTGITAAQDCPSTAKLRPPASTNLTPRTSKPPKRIFRWTPTFFRQCGQTKGLDNHSESPRKVSRIALEDSEDWEGCLSLSPTEKSPFNVKESKTVDRPKSKLEIESENLRYSQLSETSMRQFFGEQIQPTSVEKTVLTREEMSSHLSVLPQSPAEYLSPPIFLQTQRIKRHDNNSGISQDSIKIFNPMYKVRRNLQNQWGKNYQSTVLNEKPAMAVLHLSPSDFPSPKCENSTPRGSIEAYDTVPGKTIVTPENFCFGHFEQENRPTFPPQKVGHTQGRQALKDLLQSNVFQENKRNFPFGTQIFSSDKENSTRADVALRKLQTEGTEIERCDSTASTIFIPVGDYEKYELSPLISSNNTALTPTQLIPSLSQISQTLSWIHGTEVSLPSIISDEDQNCLSQKHISGETRPSEEFTIKEDAPVLPQFSFLGDNAENGVSKDVSSHENDEEEPRERHLEVPLILSNEEKKEIPEDNSEFGESPLLLTRSTTKSSLPSNSSENPWLNMTSQDFSQMDHCYCKSCDSNDSGQASQDFMASQYSFVSSSEESHCDDDDDEDGEDGRIFSITEMLRMKKSTIRKNVERIISRLEVEG